VSKCRILVPHSVSVVPCFGTLFFSIQEGSGNPVVTCNICLQEVSWDQASQDFAHLLAPAVARFTREHGRTPIAYPRRVDNIIPSIVILVVVKVNIMAPFIMYWLLQAMCPFFQPLHVHIMPVMGSLSWPLLLVLSMIPTLLVVNFCILLFGIIEATYDPTIKTAKSRPKTWSESFTDWSWSLFAFVTGINRAKGSLAIFQYGLQIWVAALLTGHSVKPMLSDTRYGC
jgi:hypothetical protein